MTESDPRLESVMTAWRCARDPLIKTRLWEISENLHRAELTELERDTHLAEWIRLTEQVEAQKAAAPVKKRGKPNDKPVQSAQVSTKGGRGKKSGISQASRELGVDRYDARRAIKVDSLTTEAPQRIPAGHGRSEAGPGGGE